METPETLMTIVGAIVVMLGSLVAALVYVVKQSVGMMKNALIAHAEIKGAIVEQTQIGRDVKTEVVEMKGELFKQSGKLDTLINKEFPPRSS